MKENDDNFEGKIDEVAIYDRALTQAEVAKHFQSGQPEGPNSRGDQNQTGTRLIPDDMGGDETKRPIMMFVHPAELDLPTRAQSGPIPPFLTDIPELVE